MLYLTTRNNADTYTAYKAITSDCGLDGGRYVPFRIPQYTSEDIAAFACKSFNEVVANILNAFFSCRLNPEDLALEIGEQPVVLVPMNHRIVVAELWHSKQADFSYIVNSIYNKISTAECMNIVPSDWVQIAVRIAVIFGIYGNMLKNDIIQAEQTIDFSVNNDNFTTPIAVWYCKKMGLPINMIICACEEDSNIWDFIHRGVFASAAASNELLLGLERLVNGTFGVDETNKFVTAYQAGKVYSVDEERVPEFNGGFFCAVAGKNRAESTINSLFRSNSYIIDPVTAICYGGLQDYRARTGGSNLTVLMAESTPLNFGNEISNATGIAVEKLIDYIKLT